MIIFAGLIFNLLFMLTDRIIEHIERLLLRHDCVIIPDFGGFVLQSVPAVYRGEEHSFTPARKEIVFNPTLTHNDGLLTESYMQKYAVDFKTALQQVRKDVSVMKDTLDEDSEFQFGRIGLFMKEEDRILFMPGKNSDLLFSTSSYGLPVFHYLSLASRKFSAGFTHEPAGAETVAGTKKTGNPSKSKNIIYTIPVTRTFIRVLATAAAAIVLFLLVFTPVEDVNKASYSASFIPQEIMPKKTADEIVSDAFSASNALGSAENVAVSSGYVTEPWRFEGTVSAPETGVNAFPDTEAGVKLLAEAKPDTAHSGAETSKSPAILPSSEKTSSAKTASKAVPGEYYVIIGSFNNRTQAQGYIKRLSGDVAAGAGIILNDGRVRVYAQQFSTEKSAQSYLDKIRQNPKHEQAWLYKGQ
jgi:hypothetical protein